MERIFWMPNLSAMAMLDGRLDKILANGNAYSTLSDDGVCICIARKEKVFTASVHTGDSQPFSMNIEVLDKAGLCRLVCDASDIQSIGYANASWKIFRRMFDGCSDSIYNCTAMDNPFDIFMDGTPHTEVCWELDDPYLGIARRFISSVESVSDQLNNFWSGDTVTLSDESEHVRMSVDQIAIARANKLYFDSFVSIYEGFLENEKERLILEMDFRIRKAEIAFENVSKTKENGYMEKQKASNEKMLRNAKLALYVSIAALIGSVIFNICSTLC